MAQYDIEKHIQNAILLAKLTPEEVNQLKTEISITHSYTGEEIRRCFQRVLVKRKIEISKEDWVAAA